MKTHRDPATPTPKNVGSSSHTKWPYSIEIVIILSGLVVMNLIFLSPAFRSGRIDREAAANLGSFVGGYIGSLFALTGVVLLYTTLRTQRESTEKQSFETRYFELLKMHRDNVAEAGLKSTQGRRLFVLLIREWRCILPIVREVAETTSTRLTKEQVAHIAYYCLFYGTGPNSSRMLRKALSVFHEAFIANLEAKLSDDELKQKTQKERRFEYKPFEGHQSRLGHYFRHLYQTVMYVDQQRIAIDKYEYVKTIRAQLSTHEQALLLINSRTPVGNSWWTQRLIVKYRLVQNLPEDFFDAKTEIDLSGLFPDGYFEWEDSRQPNSHPGTDR